MVRFTPTSRADKHLELIHGVSCLGDVQCVGVPDCIHGEEIVAFVILAEGCTMTENQVKDYVGVHLAKYKAPKYVFFTDQFPMNAAGKVLKRELSKMAAEMIRK